MVSKDSQEATDKNIRENAPGSIGGGLRNKVPKEYENGRKNGRRQNYRKESKSSRSRPRTTISF